MCASGYSVHCKHRRNEDLGSLAYLSYPHFLWIATLLGLLWKPNINAISLPESEVTLIKLFPQSSAFPWLHCYGLYLVIFLVMVDYMVSNVGLPRGGNCHFNLSLLSSSVLLCSTCSCLATFYLCCQSFVPYPLPCLVHVSSFLNFLNPTLPQLYYLDPARRMKSYRMAQRITILYTYQGLN